MEHKIGEIITLPDGRKAEVVEVVSGCRGCIYNPVGECWLEPHYGECHYLTRTDHKDIIYKEIKEDKKQCQE